MTESNFCFFHLGKVRCVGAQTPYKTTQSLTTYFLMDPSQISNHYFANMNVQYFGKFFGLKNLNGYSITKQKSIPV